MDKLQKFREKWQAFTGFTPHEAQKELLSLYDNSRFTVVAAGRRWGKSIIAAKIAEEVLLQPNKRVAIAAPTYRDCSRVFKIVWDSLITKGKYSPAEGSSYGRNVLKLPWGSEVHGVSTDSITSGGSSTSGLGDEYDLVISDEAAKMSELAWRDYLRPSLSTRRGKALLISSPWGYNHFYEKYILGQSDDEAWASIQSPTWHNTASFPLGLEDEEIQEYKRNNSKESFDQNFGAKFTTHAGRVYNEFSRDTHVVKGMGFEKGWRTYVAMDFGYRQPSVLWLQVGRIDGRDEIHIINEIGHQENLTDEQLLNKILKINKDNKYEISAYYGDPAGIGVQSQTGLGPIQTFSRKGVRVQFKTDKLSRNIPAGIEKVRSYIKDANGAIRLYVSDVCAGIISDLESYSYPEKKDGRQLSDTPTKDGSSDHGVDALRYFFINKFPLTPPTRIIQF